VSDRRESTIAKSASAIILAGGRSARMGRPKATLRFGKVTLIERTVAELARAFDDIVVVAAPESEAIELPALRTVTMMRDENAYQGPVGALARGLRAVRRELAFAGSCDLPLLRAKVASWLMSLVGDFDAVIPMVGKRLQPLHAVYHRRCAEALDAMLSRGEHRLSALAEAVNARIVSEDEYRRADPDALSCFNINTPEDYARAVKLTTAKAPPR
jgi:molybdopterin-guanine dinucleotide biosynthesis protein A